MSTSIMIHHAKSVTTNGVSEFNANAITLTVTTNSVDYEFTLFDLPLDVATRIDDALNVLNSGMTEQQIREDERRKISERLGL